MCNERRVYLKLSPLLQEPTFESVVEEKTALLQELEAEGRIERAKRGHV